MDCLMDEFDVIPTHNARNSRTSYLSQSTTQLVNTRTSALPQALGGCHNSRDFLVDPTGNRRRILVNGVVSARSNRDLGSSTWTDSSSGIHLVCCLQGILDGEPMSSAATRSAASTRRSTALPVTLLFTVPWSKPWIVVSAGLIHQVSCEDQRQDPRQCIV